MTHAEYGVPDAVIVARKHEINPSSVVWELGPPSRWLQRFVEHLADDATGSQEWKQEPYSDEITGWYLTWLRSRQRCVLFDDLPFRGDLWQSAEERMERLAWWAEVKLQFEDA